MWRLSSRVRHRFTKLRTFRHRDYLLQGLAHCRFNPLLSDHRSPMDLLSSGTFQCLLDHLRCLTVPLVVHLYPPHLAPRTLILLLAKRPFPQASHLLLALLQRAALFGNSFTCRIVWKFCAFCHFTLHYNCSLRNMPWFFVSLHFLLLF